MTKSRFFRVIHWTELVVISLSFTKIFTFLSSRRVAKQTIAPKEPYCCFPSKETVMKTYFFLELPLGISEMMGEGRLTKPKQVYSCWNLEPGESYVLLGGTFPLSTGFHHIFFWTVGALICWEEQDKKNKSKTFSFSWSPAKTVVSSKMQEFQRKA